MENTVTRTLNLGATVDANTRESKPNTTKKSHALGFLVFTFWLVDIVMSSSYYILEPVILYVILCKMSTKLCYFSTDILCLIFNNVPYIPFPSITARIKPSPNDGESTTLVLSAFLTSSNFTSSKNMYSSSLSIFLSSTK